MEMSLKVAVIGTGMGRYHMQEFSESPNVQLAAVCDLNRQEATQFARQYGCKTVVTDYHDLWGVPNLDAISIAVPNYLHAPIAIEALERDLASLLARIPYVLLLSIPGINVVSAADFAGEMGPIQHYANAKCITGRAGLFPSRYQSDQTDHADGPLVRCANHRLRAVIRPENAGPARPGR